MEVFVAGASGAIGRPLIRQLIEAGHRVTGMTRRESAASEIRATGAEAAVCDVFDRDAFQAAVTAASPEVVVHQLTSYPDAWTVKDPGFFAATNRLRTEGTRNLIAAARAAGARRVVAQSIAFVYAPMSGWVKDEDAAVVDGLGPESPLTAALELEREVLETEGIEGLVLRYGYFYGPGTSYAADGYWAAEARRRRLPIVGKGDGVSSFIQVEDAASATVAACERGAPGIYNVADDEPAPMRDWVPAYAQAVGAKRPFRVPVLVARLVGGRTAAAAAEARGASNKKAKRELGWHPGHASWRQGFIAALG